MFKFVKYNIPCSLPGSGKTSLLDIISSRSNGNVYGKVYYNNYMCTAEVIKQYAAYVMQADRLLHNLTVRETIRYAASLRLPGIMNDTEIDIKVINYKLKLHQYCKIRNVRYFNPPFLPFILSYYFIVRINKASRFSCVRHMNKVIDTMSKAYLF